VELILSLLSRRLSFALIQQQDGAHFITVRAETADIPFPHSNHCVVTLRELRGSMSGLEVLGALASAVQLADACLKVAAFISDLRDAPKTIRTRIAQIERLTEIATLIQHNSSLQTPLVDSVLGTCLEDANNLLGILKKLDTDTSVGKVVKYWKTLGGVTKEKRILGIFERLEERKSSLLLCVGSINS
jgi:hypothetical protein